MIISNANSCDNNITDKKENQQEITGYLYRHIRLDTNMPFYIGISAVNDEIYERAYSKYRSDEWKEVVKDNEYRVEILLKNIPLSVLEDKEKYFIKLYGRIDLGTGTLVNKTSGGRGSCGRVYITTEETRKKQSDIKKGKKLSPEHVDKLRGKKRTEETRKKMSEAKKTPEYAKRCLDISPRKKIGQYKDNILIKEYPSLKSTELDGFNFGAVGACCRGAYGFNTHKGYVWGFL